MGRIKRGVAAVAVAAATAVGMGAPGASATNVGVSGAVGTGFISYTPPLGVTPVHTTWSYSTTIIGLAIAAAVPPPPLPAISPTYTAACTFAGSSNGILGSPPVGEDAAVGGGSVTGTCAADASGTRLALAGTGTYARVGNVMVITGPA
ncbi:MAG: hypothetical protein QOI20_1212, partial [Acidimicrobiaceae bacterium]|nr:hypothetical protein [Acidimicrobiaceae bacterium]